MRGGVGGDWFTYEQASDSTAAAMDRILDFQKTVDRIDLSAIDAIATTAANDAFTFIGVNAAFTGAGQLRVRQDSSGWFVEGDVNGDGAADLTIQIGNGGTIAWASSDFLL